MTTFLDQLVFARSGKMYNDVTPELIEARKRTVLLTNPYNNSFDETTEVRETLLRELLGSIGQRVYFEPTFRCEFGHGIEIGAE